MALERADAVTFIGQPMTLVGPELKAGDKAGDFRVLAGDLSEVTLASDPGKIRLILSIPCLDTGICDAEVRRFNQEATAFGDSVVVYAISVDLPPTQSRWCAAAGVRNVRVLSDHRAMSFGEAFGTFIKEIRQLSRAIFIVDGEDTVQYAQYLPAVGQHPDYEDALAALRKLI